MLQLSELTIRLLCDNENSSICCYGSISRQASFLIFGGIIDNSDFSLIAKYTVDKWERVGNLQHVRYAHRAITNENRIYIVGGAYGIYAKKLYVHTTAPKFQI